MDKQSFLSAAKGLSGAGKKPLEFIADSGDDPAADWYKLFVYGPPGSGKTNIITGLLESGERVFDADTDFGGNGLRTVKNTLRKAGKESLLKNLRSFDFGSGKEAYLRFAAWLDNPGIVKVKGDDGTLVTLYDWAPTVIVWEGFSVWQQIHLDEYALSLEAGSNATEARREGLLGDQQTWGVIKKGTFRNPGEFLTMHNINGQKWSKIVTAYEGTPRENDITHERKPGADIQGSARNWFTGGFDLVIRTSTTSKPDGSTKYIYECNPGKSFTKTRGIDVPASMEADPIKLWQIVKGQ